MSANGQRKRILVLDDSPIVLEALAGALQSMKLDVKTAENIEQFERELAANKPDVIVLDVHMPEMFGDDVAQVLRSVRKLNCVIVLFSSLDEPTLAARAAEAGVDHYVSKDAGVPALVQRVLQLVRAQV